MHKFWIKTSNQERRQIWHLFHKNYKLHTEIEQGFPKMGLHSQFPLLLRENENSPN